MLPVLQFVFSNFWIWLGTVILVGATAASVARWVSLLVGVVRAR